MEVVREVHCCRALSASKKVTILTLTLTLTLALALAHPVTLVFALQVLSLSKQESATKAVTLLRDMQAYSNTLNAKMSTAAMNVRLRPDPKNKSNSSPNNNNITDNTSSSPARSPGGMSTTSANSVTNSVGHSVGHSVGSSVDEELYHLRREHGQALGEIEAIFEQFDVDHDGVMNRTELQACMVRT